MTDTRSLIEPYLRAAATLPDAARLDCITGFAPTAVYYGRDPLRVLPDLIRGWEIPEDARVLIVTGMGGVRRAGYYDAVLSHLPGRGIIDCGNVTPDALVSKVDEIATVMRQTDPGLIIALGGGSAMDAAATAAAFQRRPIRRIAIPTTAGTGSEVTSYSVLTGEGNEKLFNISRRFYPDAAILTPGFLATVPRSVIGAVAADSIAHAFEALISPRATPESDAAALAALHLFGRHLERHYDDPADMRAAAPLSLAACFAGVAFDRAFTAACHGFSFAIAKEGGMSHGEACAMTLEMDIKFNLERLRAVAPIWGLRDVKEVPGRLRRLFDHVGMTDAARRHFGRMDDAMTRKMVEGLPPYRAMIANDPGMPGTMEYLGAARRNIMG